MITLRATTGTGKAMSIDGTLMGIKQTQKIVGIDSFRLDLPPTDNILFIRYVDRPGIIGIVGQTLGESKVNIAAMQVARSEAGGTALMALTVDSHVSEDIVAKVKKDTEADFVRSVFLVD
jgi:D-3-phosphoglycerate dehydrogenase